MEEIGKEIFKKLYKPPADSHKGQNGKLTIIGGSKLFHGASLWALKTASRIVDMVFYSTVKENEELTKKLKSEIYDFICVLRDEIEDYIRESDAVLIGPGMVRVEGGLSGIEYTLKKIEKINEIKNEGILTYYLTKYLLKKFPNKKWIIDAGSLQMMEAAWLRNLKQVIITPHLKEFCQLFKCKITDKNSKFYEKLVSQKAKEYTCTIVLKGSTDIVCSPEKCVYNTTGNEGMTKGGTGDVLAGLITALACKNDLFLASCAGVYVNGLAGDELYKKVGPYFNASDLCDQIPKTMKGLFE